MACVDAMQTPRLRRRTEDHRQVEGHDAGLRHQPEERAHRPRVRVPAHLCQVAPRHEAEPRRERLQVDGHEVGHDEEPELGVAKAGAAVDGGGPIAGVQVRDLQV